MASSLNMRTFVLRKLFECNGEVPKLQVSLSSLLLIIPLLIPDLAWPLKSNVVRWLPNNSF